MSTEKYIAANGTTFTDEDIERWAAVDEDPDGPGWTGGRLSAPVVGRPVSIGHEVKPFTLRLDGRRRAKLAEIAHQRHTTASQLVRDLIDTL